MKDIDKKVKMYSLADVLKAFEKSDGSAEGLMSKLTGLSPGELAEMAGAGQAAMKTISLRDVAGITLLTVGEYWEARFIVPQIDGWWWLRTPGHNSDYAAIGDHYGGGVVINGRTVGDSGGSVLPALRLDPESDDLQIGDRVLAAGRTWTVIPGNLALCDGSIGEHCFREDWKVPDANDYKASDVRKFLEGWAREHGLMPKEICARDVVSITLLSKEEYEEAEDIVPKLNGWWWLRSPGYLGFQAAVVVYGGDVDDYVRVDDTDVYVRPVLQLNPQTGDLQPGDKIRFAGNIWTVIPGDLALCNEFIGKKPSGRTGRHRTRIITRRPMSGNSSKPGRGSMGCCPKSIENSYDRVPMKIVIDIPKEYIPDWEKDRFADALGRLSADAHCAAGLYELETAQMLAGAFRNAETEADLAERLHNEKEQAYYCGFEDGRKMLLDVYHESHG